MIFRLIDLIYMLLLCHENDVRLIADNNFQNKVASLYLPLIGIIVDKKKCLFYQKSDNLQKNTSNR